MSIGIAGPILSLEDRVIPHGCSPCRKQQLPHGASAEPLSDVDRVKADAAIPEVGDTVGGYVLIDGLRVHAEERG